MKNIISLALVLVFAVAVLSVCTAAIPIPYVYEFDTWRGSGTSSLTINSYGNEFMYIRADEKLGEGDYTVTEDGEKLTITLSEEYLKTLSADEVGGFYDFTIEMKYAEPKRHDNVEVELIGDSNKAVILFTGGELGKLDKLFYGEEEIDPSHYTFDRGDIVFSTDYFYDETGAPRFESGTLFRASFVNDSYTLYSKITEVVLMANLYSSPFPGSR